ncbi:MAG: S-layer homology domain-containing protein [Oscillospiraceae bacterium]|nr:S-layer homology domain-containing protein [Oscillospiraceae bacterium]
MDKRQRKTWKTTLSLLLCVCLITGPPGVLAYAESADGMQVAAAETSYSITGYEGEHGSVTPNSTSAEAGMIVTLTVAAEDGYALSAMTAGSATLNDTVSANTATYTFTMPAEDVVIDAEFTKIVLRLFAQEGENGTPRQTAVFTSAELYANSETNEKGYGYLFYKSDVWNVLIAKTLVPIDTLFSISGLSEYWTSGSYLTFLCGDGPYSKTYPYYENINECCYYYEDGTQTVVPAGLALTWNSGSLADRTFDEIAAGTYDSGRMRWVYGISQEQYENQNAAGSRTVTNMYEITVVYSASTIPKGSVGVEHTYTTTILDDLLLSSTNLAVDAISDDSGAAATASVDAAELTSALETAVQQAETAADGSTPEVKVTVALESSVNVYTLNIDLPVSALQAIAAAQAQLTLSNARLGGVSFDQAALESLIAGASQGERVTITIAFINWKDLSEDLLQKLLSPGNLYVISATVGADPVTAFDGRVICYMPFVTPNGVNDDDVIACRVMDDGTLMDVQNGSYIRNDFQFVFTVDKPGEFSVTDQRDAIQIKLLYTDTQSTDWFYDAVLYAYANDLMTGLSETSFGPNQETTRSMLVTVLYRYAGEPIVTAKNTFSDVKSDQWYTDAVIWAADKRIVDGYSSGVFGPDDTVTREQLATILYRYAQNAGIDTSQSDALSAYTDAAAIDDWALPAMKWAVATGVISGTDSGIITPQGNATRAQIATVLMRYIQMMDY